MKYNLGVQLMKEKPYVFILSDSVGETAELVIKAGLSQFNKGDFTIHVFRMSMISLPLMNHYKSLKKKMVW